MVAYHHYRMGSALFKKGEYERALEHFLKAQKLDSQNPLILNHLGLAYYLQKEYEYAVMALNEALILKKNYSEAHNNLGRVYVDMKDFSRARKHLFKAVSDLTYPNRDKVWLNIGLSFFEENRYKKSEEYFLKALKANRQNCLAYNYYGRSLLEREKFKSAIKAFDRAIYRCRPYSLDQPHYYSAVSLFQTGQKSRAIARLKEGKKLYPKGSYREKIRDMIALLEGHSRGGEK